MAIFVIVFVIFVIDINIIYPISNLRNRLHFYAFFKENKNYEPNNSNTEVFYKMSLWDTEI